MNNAEKKLIASINFHNAGAAAFWDHPMTTWCNCNECVKALISGKNAIHTAINMKEILQDTKRMEKKS